MDWENEQTVVTGGCGFIGSHLVDKLAEKQDFVTVIDNLVRGREENIAHNMTGLYDGPGVSRWNCDVSEKLPCRLMPHHLTWEPTLSRSIVFHLAAQVTGIQYNVAHNLDMLEKNLAINSGLVHAIRHIKSMPKLLIWVSTACIYPHDAPVPTPESYGDICNPEPTNFGYGVAKWVGEQQARFLCKEYGIPTIIVRFFNAFGPRDYYDKATSHVAPALIRRVMEGENPLRVWGSGEQTRVLVDARDIAKALVMLAEEVSDVIDFIAMSVCETPLPDGATVPDSKLREDFREEVAVEFPYIVNIGHSREISISDLAHTIVNMAHELYDIPKPSIIFDTSKPDGYPRRAADTTRLQSLIGWVPDTPIEDTLYAMFEDYLRQKELGWIND